jgi:hypothetical protein
VSALPNVANRQSSRFTGRLTGLNLQVQDFPGLALERNLQRAATDFAIGCKLLGALTGVNHQGKTLSAEWTLNVFGNLHFSGNRAIIIACQTE